MNRERMQRTWLFVTVFIAGASVLILEILGTRILSPFYGTTVFVWSSLIVVTLGALALGYAAGGRLADKFPNAQVLYAGIFLAGIFFLLPMRIDEFVLPFTDPLGLQYGPLAASFLLFFAPLFLLGFDSPFVIRLITRETTQSGTSSGSIFALSTVGSICGGLLAGFFLIDVLPISSSLTITAGFLISVALIGLLLERRGDMRVPAYALLILGFAFLTPTYAYQDTYTLQIHRQEQSFYGDLKVIEIGQYKCLAVNGSFQSCFNVVENRPTYTYLAEVGRLIEEREVGTILLLGLGSGNVLHFIPPDVELDIVEIDPNIARIAKESFGLSLLENQHLIIDDARHFLAHSEKKYDLILVDIALGNILPAHIFSKESMEDWRTALAEGGLVLINGEGKLGEKDMQLKTILHTANSVFPSVFLTVTEPERFSSVLAHLSLDPGYTFGGGGQFVYVPIEYSDAPVMTDNFNWFDKISLEKLAIFRAEMTNVAGLKLLFAH